MGVKIRHSFSVHLFFPRIPLFQVNGDFPRILRVTGLGVQRFSLEEAVRNAENLIDNAERRYSKGKKALNELFSVWPDFIHHPRVQGLLKKAFSQSDYRFSRPPGRPRKGIHIDDHLVFAVVERLRQPPIKMSLRKIWIEVADKWKTHYSSVRDAYQRACQRLKPLAIIDLSNYAQEDQKVLEINARMNRKKVTMRPFILNTREPVNQKVQIVPRFRLTPSGVINVRAYYEVNGTPCALIIQPELNGKILRAEPLSAQASGGRVPKTAPIVAQKSR